MIIRRLGLQEYGITHAAMQKFTQERTACTEDELWVVEHPSVYTQGQAGKPEHLLTHSAIPVIQSDRGGQITYHGPGQLIVYVLFDLRRRNLGIRSLVNQLEQLIIDVLATLGLQGHRECGAPGVYIHHQKIAAIGLRVKQGCTYHGIALNIAMDLQPYHHINPCGYPGLLVTQIKNYCSTVDYLAVEQAVLAAFFDYFEDKHD
jgi:lipoyl(octanoyl) transferase